MQDIDKDGRDRLNFIAFGAGKYRCPGKFFAYHVRSLPPILLAITTHQLISVCRVACRVVLRVVSCCVSCRVVLRVVSCCVSCRVACRVVLRVVSCCVSCRVFTLIL
jgi:hypothetical protein